MVLVGCLGRSVAPDELGDYRRFVGLKNQGNTCHLNVILQALFMTPELREGLLEVCSTVDPKSVAPLPRSLAALFHRLATGSRPCSTGPITKSLRGYGMNRQQDCHDTYLLLCARLETDLKGTSQSLLTRELFQGKQRDYVKCQACQHTSFTEDLFSNLSINLPNAPARTAASSDRQGRESSERDDESAADDVTDTTGDPAGEENDGDTTPSVRTALRATLAPEQLVGDDQYECDKCKCKRDAERGVRLSVLPPILVIHLKRFATSYERDKRGRVKLKLTKLNLALHVDRTLDMREFVAPIEADLVVPEYAEGDKATATSGVSDTEAVYSCTSEPLSLGEADDGRDSCQPVSVVGLSDGMSSGLVSETEAQEAESEGDRSMLYDLYGVLIHAGSLEKGHYFALIKDIETDEWYRFDDEKVSRLPTNRLDAELRRSHGGDGASASAYMLLYRSKADRVASTNLSPNDVSA
ncbi:hypothetical protein AB1Y20_003283 [Prymnesium parvum]|uniref:USP domain-containing protein n=1 Tax=Prymnesium parvum TaxID=97485 RepID=A0AB34JB54_PRYPA